MGVQAKIETINGLLMVKSEDIKPYHTVRKPVQILQLEVLSSVVPR